MELGLRNKIALITGGSKGIGKATAYRLSLEGANVAICARNQVNLLKAAGEIRDQTKGVILPIVSDVCRPDDVSELVKITTEKLGGIDILINNAGTSSAMPFEKVNDEEWIHDLDLKLFSAIRLIKAVLPYMRNAGGGRIINITTPAGKAPGPSSTPTSVSRAAGIALTKALSKDLAKDNILVNTVCIGLIKSGQHEDRYKKALETEPELTIDEYYERLARGRGVPLGRVGEATEAADVIAFLASSNSSYITGTSINIDGGTSAVI